MRWGTSVWFFRFGSICLLSRILFRMLRTHLWWKSLYKRCKCKKVCVWMCLYLWRGEITKIVGAACTTPLVFYILYVGTDGGIKTVSSSSLRADETRRLVPHRSRLECSCMAVGHIASPQEDLGYLGDVSWCDYQFGNTSVLYWMRSFLLSVLSRMSWRHRQVLVCNRMSRKHFDVWSRWLTSSHFVRSWRVVLDHLLQSSPRCW